MVATSKLHIELAKSLKMLRPSGLNYLPTDTGRALLEANYELWYTMCCAIQLDLADDNPRFDHGKFRTACGMTELPDQI